MEEELSGDIIKTTQLTLGKFIKRPPLTEKLLKKPPFRFLHDIITAVQKSTGFFEGLFEEDELISDNVKDRESKIQFLNKVINVLSKTLQVKPSKIIAGQEPVKTNELLQCLGEVLEKKLSSSEAVKKYKESLKVPLPNDKKNKDNVKVIKKKQDTKKVIGKDENEKEQKPVPKLRLRENTTIKGDLPPKKSQRTTVLKKSVSKNSQAQTKTPSQNIKESAAKLDQTNISNDGKNSEISENNACTQDVNEDKIQQQQSENEETNLPNKNSMNNLNQHFNHQQPEINKTGENDDQNTNNYPNTEKKEKTVFKEEQTINNDAETSEPGSNDKRSEEIYTNIPNTLTEKTLPDSFDKISKSVRPSSSRPGAPRVKEKHDILLTVPENPIAHKVNIIVENSVPEEEEDGVVIIEDKQGESEEQIQLSSNHHGHLVQQILDSQKEFSQISGKTEIEWQFGVQKARDIVNQEIEQMRFNVQALSRISNPLGKLIDHIQEDVEVMRQELQEWTRKYDETSKELAKEKIASAESLQPLQAKIKQLDADIVEKRDKINDLRIVVHKNYYRIEKLLSSGTVQ
ncbi:TRAF3-interacting protein 1-like isoform X2 [Battus philenor]|uniref:TRAF3-interacting protein 1-like isoform X2 n=1 Tax=Battus philenor TaxID=42288 RepID=UPI0035CFF4E7